MGGFKEWQQELEERLAVATAGVAEVAALAPPSVQSDLGDVLAWRQSLGLAGPATAADLASAAGRLLGGTANALESARFTIERAFASTETAILCDRSGLVILPADYGDKVLSISDPELGTAMALPMAAFPEGHAIRSELLAENCYRGMAVLGPPAVDKVDGFGGRVRRPKKWYTTRAAVETTRKWCNVHAQRAKEEAELEARQQRDREAEERRRQESDPLFMVRKLQQRIFELEGKR